MSATTDLWMIFSVDRGFHTARGWNRSSDFALLFTKPEADQFVSEHADEVLVPIHYDPQAAHNQTIRVIGHKKDRAEIHHDLHRVALAELSKLESRRGVSDVQVEVVHNISMAPAEEHLTGLVQQALGELKRRQSTVFTGKFDCALKKFDKALEAYRGRVHPYEVRS
jgi:hypothetical protein